LLIKGDRVQLQQVLLNLIVNAIEEMSNKPAAERRIKVGTARRDKVAEIIVSDNGSGIPADKLDQIFRPFSSTKPSGMGIGLSIARTIVEAHHGRIRAENREEGGATFYVSLPLS
jgi:signal transduction histidine kinase